MEPGGGTERISVILLGGGARRAKRARGLCSSASLGFGLYKILFYFEAFVHESIIMVCPTHLHSPHYCNTIARLLPNIRRPPPTALGYAIYHAILVMAIACKGQFGCRFGSTRSSARVVGVYEEPTENKGSR